MIYREGFFDVLKWKNAFALRWKEDKLEGTIGIVMEKGLFIGSVGGVFFISIDDVIGAAAFLFVSGISTSLSFNNRKSKSENSEEYTKKIIRDEYFLRALFIFIIAILFNIIYGWLFTRNILNLWRWYFLLTIAFSLVL
ncbi:unnamed protein product, partial [marine sediment metagenome]